MFAKSLLKILLMMTLIFFTVTQVFAAAKYPIVGELHGKVWLNGKDGKREVLKTKKLLVERAHLETTENSWVTVQLDPHRSFVVYENSEILLPTISWEEGDAPVILLKRGRLRWQQLTAEKAAYNVALRSDLFEFLAPPGDFLFTMTPEKAYAEVKVLKGHFEFSALNGDESVTVHEGQEAGFQGILEGKDIAYDVLLKGKKIPRGHLTPVVSIDKKEWARYDDEGRKRRTQMAKEAQRKKALAEAVKAGSICTSPAGSFNQCAWICLGNPKSEKKHCLTDRPGVSCVRRRCNANGQWAEESPVDSQKSSILCGAQPVVAPCDY